MITKYPAGLFLKMLAAEDDEMSQIGIPITQLWDDYLDRVLHNKKLNGGIAACYETWFYEYP